MGALRAVLLGVTFLGMIASRPLWVTSREYPLLPISPLWPQLHAPWDQLCFGLTLVSLVLAAWWFRQAVVFFLVCLLFLYLGDQNRGQPWIYMYAVMLGLACLPEATALAACRCILSAVYVWGGINKCNPNFFRIIPEWFVSPATAWGWPDTLVHLCRTAVVCAPAIEILIGVLLWLPRFKWMALAAVVILHGAALLFLGPLGHSYNWVVWPWNLAMVLLAWILFAVPGDHSFAQACRVLVRSKKALCIVALVSLLPILSFLGWWDSYFSFALYSGNLATADVYVAETFRDRLPEDMRRFVRQVRPSYDPQWQAPYLFDYTSWAMHALGSPGLPEPRGYRSMFRYLNQFAATPGEVHMILVPRRGPMLLCRGDTAVPIAFEK